MQERKYLLMSRANPNGYKLEELAEQLMDEVAIKNSGLIKHVIDDTVAATVFENNNKIIQLLSAIKATQLESLKALATKGLDQGPLGEPRIGDNPEPVVEEAKPEPVPSYIMEDEAGLTVKINRDKETSTTHELDYTDYTTGKMIIQLHTDMLGFDYNSLQKAARNREILESITFKHTFSAVEYAFKSNEGEVSYLARIKFQDGPIQMHGVNGIQVEDLIELCQARLRNVSIRGMDMFTNNALTKLTEAGMWLAERRANRAKRQVEGTDRK